MLYSKFRLVKIFFNILLGVILNIINMSLILSNQGHCNEDLKFDIVINGGTFSAPATALEAARANPQLKILLIEPTDWLGGQATSQGVAAIDNAWHNPGATLMRNNPELYYPKDYLDFLERIKNPPIYAVGEGFAPTGSAWVTREAFDPRTAAWVLDQMISELPNITVMKLTVVKDVDTTSVTDFFGEGKKITALTIIQRIPINGYKPLEKFLSQEILDWYKPTDSTEFHKVIYRIVPLNPNKGLVVIDASELADVIVLSGAKYTVGREKTTEKMNEDGTPPEMDERGSQAFVFTFCMTGQDTNTLEIEHQTQFPDFASYYQEQLQTYFSMGSHTWNRIWTYRRLKNVGSVYDWEQVNKEDVTMQNWYPGNDYPYGTYLKNKEECLQETDDWLGGIFIEELARSEKHAIAWYFYMKEHKTVAWDTILLHGEHHLNMMGTAHGLSKYPYIRCTRRAIGLHNFRMTERYFVDTASSDYNGGASFRYYDSVGIGNYAVDIHPTKISKGISPSFSNAAPFYIPFRSLGSANIRNLLVGGKSIGATYITNAAYRLHPIEWAIGSACGAAAALMFSMQKTNYEMLDIPNLRNLQQLTIQNSPISWAAFDSEPIPQLNGDLIVNNFKKIQEGIPFQIEVYHNRAVKAKVFLSGILIGETATRANGRLILNVESAPTGSKNFYAICYDADDKIIDIIDISDKRDLTIIDNEDPEFSYVGDWKLGTAQPDKYKTSYRYLFYTDGPGTATWQIFTPVKGLYEISVWYPQSSNRATDSPFTIYHADGTTTVRINQQINGGKWISLGKFNFNADLSGKITLSNDISDQTKLVVADAVKAVLITTKQGLFLY